MKKIYTLLSLLVLCGIQLTAQSYSITPSNKNVSGSVYFNQNVDIEIAFDNILSGNLFLGYKTITNTLDPSWNVTWCDYQTCYPFVPMNTEEMDTLFQGGHAFVKMSVNPTSVSATGCVEFEIYDMNGTQRDTVSLCVNVLGVSIENELANSITISPNPASSYVHLSSVQGLLMDGNISLTNLAGQVVYSMQIVASSMVTVPLENFESGLYFLNYETETGRVVNKIQVIK